MGSPKIHLCDIAHSSDENEPKVPSLKQVFLRLGYLEEITEKYDSNIVMIYTFSISRNSI